MTANGQLGTGNSLLLLYYITDRTQFSGSESNRQEQLLARIADAARAGIDYIQLREKDLSPRDLENLSFAVVKAARNHGKRTRVLINSRTDIALTTGADGVHLRSNDISPADVRRVWRAAGRDKEPLVAVSCHQSEAVRAAKLAGADFVVFGPVFGKFGQQPAGLSALDQACSHGIPVLALGGVTPENAMSCIENGAAGVAGIRLFQQGALASTIDRLGR